MRYSAVCYCVVYGIVYVMCCMYLHKHEPLCVFRLRIRQTPGPALLEEHRRDEVIGPSPQERQRIRSGGGEGVAIMGEYVLIFGVEGGVYYARGHPVAPEHSAAPSETGEGREVADKHIHTARAYYMHVCIGSIDIHVLYMCARMNS